MTSVRLPVKLLLQAKNGAMLDYHPRIYNAEYRNDLLSLLVKKWGRSLLQCLNAQLAETVRDIFWKHWCRGVHHACVRYRGAGARASRKWRQGSRRRVVFNRPL